MRRVAIFVPHEGCPRQCVFCNQRSISGTSVAPLPKEVEEKLESALEILGDRAQEAEIAFFGGSFTAINRTYRNSLLEAAAKYCGGNGFSGIRFSTRPDCINSEILADIGVYPVTHIELGVQSMSDRVLHMNKRGHTSQDTVRAVELLKKSGYTITLQMMVGMYGDNWDGAVDTAYQIAELEPSEVRIYPTLVLKNTDLETYYNNKMYTPLEISSTIKVCAEMLDIFAERGIRVIRLGLHDEEGLKSQVVAGPHHPALRELSEGYRLYNKALDLLEKKGVLSGKEVLCISPRDISKVKGHGGWILSLLENKGYNMKVKTSNKIELGNIEIE